MTNDAPKKRYSGSDSQPWTVKGSNGKAVVLDKDGKTPTQFTVYKDAQYEADKYIKATGQFAQPVRS